MGEESWREQQGLDTTVAPRPHLPCPRAPLPAAVGILGGNGDNRTALEFLGTARDA